MTMQGARLPLAAFTVALANETVCDLFRSIFTDSDTCSADRAIARVLAIGSTSGADMLTGVVLALGQNMGESEP